MELSEQVATINRQLSEEFGVDIGSAKPIFRVVWSNDEYEHRHGTWQDYDKNGVKLREITETRYVPKYWNKKDKYVLERLVGVPEQNREELANAKVSYEPIWFFEHYLFKFYLPPKYEVAKAVIDCLLAAMGHKGYAKYVDETVKQAVTDPKGYQKARVDALMADMFGNETPLADALSQKSGISLSGVDLPPKLS